MSAKRISEDQCLNSKKSRTVYYGRDPEYKPVPKYYTYKDNSYVCKKCSSIFLGEDAQIGECSKKCNYWTLECPDCNDYIDSIPFATWEQIMEFDPDEEVRQKVKKYIERDNKRKNESLKMQEQLVDIDSDEIILTFYMETVDDEYMLIKCQDVILWKQPAYPGNLDDYFKIRNILEDKYGDRIKRIDFTGATKTCFYWNKN